MIKSVKGTSDLIYPETRRWRRVEEAVRRVLGRYGFTEIRTPVLEHTELFARSIGGETDIVTKEMYTFLDRKGRSLTLRPENTAGVVRSYVEMRLHDSPIHQRLFYIGPQFRYERPQKGRLRQFHQFGAEVLGEEAPSCDAEVIQSVMELLTELGVSELKVQINSVGCPVCRPGYVETLRAYLEHRLEGLCGDCRRRVETNTLRVLDCKVPSCGEIIKDAPPLRDSLCEGCAAHHAGFLEAVTALDIPHRENPRLVRGLDYYTRTVFEVTSGALGAQDAILGGGRYDGLIQELGGPALPAFGYAVGMERLLMAIPEESPGRSDWVYLAWLGETARIPALLMARELRSAGITVAMEHGGRSLKSAMKRADKMNTGWTLILGENEIESKRYLLKNLDTGMQESLDLEGVIARIRDS